MSKRYILSVLACGSLLASSLHAGIIDSKSKTQQEGEWKSFTSTQGNFSISFPSEPQEVDQHIDIPNTDLSIRYQTYLSEPQENVVYVVSVWTYPSEIDMSHPDINLQDGFGGMISALPGSEVVSMELKDFQGFKSLTFLVRSEEIYFQGMLLLANNTLYQVFAVYKENQKDKVDYAKFIGSFKLLHVLPASTEQGAKASKLKV